MAATTAGLPAAPSVRGRNILVGTGFAVAGVIMYFAGLFGVYFQQRAQFRSAGQEWIPGSVRIELTPPGMIVWTLILGCAVVALVRSSRSPLPTASMRWRPRCAPTG